MRFIYVLIKYEYIIIEIKTKLISIRVKVYTLEYGITRGTHRNVL